MVKRSGRSRWIWLAVIPLGVVALALLALALFPWGALRTMAEERLSASLDRPVTIASAERTDRFSFHPTILLRGVRIPQAAWAGQGDLLNLATARVRFAALPLLLGDLRIEAVELDGMKIALVRDAAGRESWNNGKKDRDKAASRPAISTLTIANSSLSYADAKRDRSFTAALSADINRGLTLSGTGLIRGAPVTLTASGGAIAGVKPGTPWPFRAEIAGKAVGMTAVGRMDGPLDIGHLTAAVTGYGDDLRMLDAIIEAGLPGTQPVKLKANVRRDSPDWIVTALTGTIGRSDIAGHATIRKRDGRTRIEGAIASNRFDFNSLSSDEGLRKGALLKARIGDRIVPPTAIDLKSVARTDGRLELSVKQLLWPGSSPFRHLRGTLTLEQSHLKIEPLTLGLTRGRLDGRITVDQRKGGPMFTVDLTLAQARLLDFFPATAIDGSLAGRIRLSGPGGTIRAAIGRSSGSIALVARDGTIPARTASLLGQDVGRGVTGDKEEMAVLRCMVARLDVSRGVAQANPVVIDTSRALTRVTGRISLADERLMLTLSGAPKKQSLLRLAGTIPIGGTITHPDIQVPEQTKSAGGILKMLGRAIAGKQGAVAADANCGALTAKALR
ncbi:AsmA family protein [Sphingobium boeckii]|uniref:AsmA domain-containing protein n=1 Tax=Sphingobium boeckii TaxID=1082345 RepID=A0A7W9AI35_9SPHN|nr:AsmA family protein [Sphingobium boeckii]MBB5686039.1 hypothetical protein [Sphingobium boeckii]